MNIRNITQGDLLVIEGLWRQSYQNDFSFPDFYRNWLSTFLISNDDGTMITAGGVKLFSEIVLITDTEQSQRDRHDALKLALQTSRFVSQSAGHNNLYASAKGEWANILRKVGFNDSADNNLVIS